VTSEPSLDFVVVGAQRAGSTHLSACLADHPALFVCPDEVPYFEDPFFANTPPSALAPALAGAEAGQRRGIQRPEYLARPECPARIHDHSPQARIVAVLRDPVDRAVSAYFWYVQFGLLPLAPLNVGMEAILDGTVDPSYRHAPEIVDYGFYGRHLDRYVSAFGSDQVLVLLGDELSQPSAFARVYGFLGIDPGHRPQPKRAPANEGVYDPRRLRVLRARRRLVWSWDGVTTYDYRPRRRRRPWAFIPNAAVVAFDRAVLKNLYGNEKPSLRQDLEARLRSHYQADMEQLEPLIGRDLSSWKRSGA
jgi:hypothetical protein